MNQSVVQIKKIQTESLISIHARDCAHLLNIRQIFRVHALSQEISNIISEYEIPIRAFYRILMDVFSATKNIIEEIISLKS